MTAAVWTSGRKTTTSSGRGRSVLRNCEPRVFTNNTLYSSEEGGLPFEYPGNHYYAEQPTGTQVFVRPNRCEPGRAHVAIYNWDSRAEVSVDLVDASLVKGERYVIQDVQNLFGRPVVEGIFDGSPAVVRMVGLEPGPVVGDIPGIAHTAPRFGAFLVSSSRRLSQPPPRRRPRAWPATPAPSPSPTSSKAGDFDPPSERRFVSRCGGSKSRASGSLGMAYGKQRDSRLKLQSRWMSPSLVLLCGAVLLSVIAVAMMWGGNSTSAAPDPVPAAAIESESSPCNGGRAFYVAPDGQATNDGSKERPLESHDGIVGQEPRQALRHRLAAGRDISRCVQERIGWQ